MSKYRRKSSTVQGLDGSNSEAVLTLVQEYMINGHGSSVVEALGNVIDRNPWVKDN